MQKSTGASSHRQILEDQDFQQVMTPQSQLVHLTRQRINKFHMLQLKKALAKYLDGTELMKDIQSVLIMTWPAEKTYSIHYMIASRIDVTMA